MCYQMLPIATYDDRHFIGQCEHGTLHLNWGRLVLSMHPDEFLLIARTLRRYEPESRLPLATPHVALLWNDQDVAQVWLVHVGLYVGSEALAVLLALLVEASAYITNGSPALLNQHDLVQMPDYRRAAPPN